MQGQPMPEDDGPKGNMWQHPFIQNILPFLSSLAMHAAIVIFAIASYTVYKEVIQPAIEEQFIVNSAEIVEGADIGGVINPGTGGDPNRAARQNIDENVPDNSEGWADKKSTNFQLEAAGGGSGNAGSRMGDNTGFGAGGGLGTGFGTGTGGGTGDGSGALAPFGVPGGGGGIGPKAPFIGMSGNATRVAFVCDASGSMLSEFDSLRVQLRISVNKLKPIQFFNIIFFQNQGAMALADNLIPATAENKRKAEEFLLNVGAANRTDPLPAIEKAFSHNPRPQLLYLLTDGEFPSNDEVIKKIKDLNRNKKVLINTIAFVNRDDTYERVLRKIADENGGDFRYVSRDDLR